jgi:hypothetical protein
MWKRIIIIIVLAVVLLAISLFVQKFNSEKLEAPVIQDETVEENIMPITVRHQYKDGIHTIVGDLSLPTPCHSYNAVIEDTEDDAVKNILVEYKEPEDGTGCVSVIEDVTFRVSTEGPEDLKFNIFVNGEERRLNMFDLSPDVDIDEFELFIKG